MMGFEHSPGSEVELGKNCGAWPPVIEKTAYDLRCVDWQKGWAARFGKPAFSSATTDASVDVIMTSVAASSSARARSTGTNSARLSPTDRTWNQKQCRQDVRKAEFHISLKPASGRSCLFATFCGAKVPKSARRLVNRRDSDASAATSVRPHPD